MVVGGLSALGAGLYSMGIPRDSILQDETAVKADKFLVVVHGTADESAKAKEILSRTRSTEVTDHPLSMLSPRPRSARPGRSAGLQPCDKEFGPNAGGLPRERAFRALGWRTVPHCSRPERRPGRSVRIQSR